MYPGSVQYVRFHDYIGYYLPGYNVQLRSCSYWSYNRQHLHEITYDIIFLAIINYLNRPDVREMLGADDRAGSFQTCNLTLFDRFEEGLDKFHTAQPYVAQLLERGIRVLMYVGEPSSPLEYL